MMKIRFSAFGALVLVVVCTVAALAPSARAASSRVSSECMMPAEGCDTGLVARIDDVLLCPTDPGDHPGLNEDMDWVDTIDAYPCVGPLGTIPLDIECLIPLKDDFRKVMEQIINTEWRQAYCNCDNHVPPLSPLKIAACKAAADAEYNSGRSGLRAAYLVMAAECCLNPQRPTCLLKTFGLKEPAPIANN